MATNMMHFPGSKIRKPMHGLPTCDDRKYLKLGHVSLTANAGDVVRVKTCAHMPTGRRSGHYKPSLWSFDYIQSWNSDYGESRYLSRASDLEKQVKMLLDKEMDSVRQLEVIDDLQRLGISYHFENEIDRILDCLYTEGHCINYKAEKRSLHSTALEFRLLREHGFTVPQEVFDSFKNEKGDFEPSLGDDVVGMLQLYEASFLLTPGERTLEQATEFTKRFLEEKLKDDFLGIDESLELWARHALELPIHWRPQWPNARWYMDAYSRRPDMNPILLELAKINFNIVQATHLQELKHVSMWWKQTGLAEGLPFARDRLVECYFWTLGELFQPQYGYLRIQITKVNSLITVIDDIFDIHGTLDELKLFNDAFQTWDIEAIEKLPHYMKMCHLALNNVVNEMAYDVMKEQGFLIISHLRKSWRDLCRSYLVEAEWVSMGYTPTLEEYMSNAWISISAITILSNAFFVITNPIKKEAVEKLFKYHEIVRCSGTILRLANDMGTSTHEMARGDVPKSIECYMNEMGASREEAGAHIRFTIAEAWKRTNEEAARAVHADCPLIPRIFVRYAVDLGRMAQYMYEYGDGHGIQNHQIKNRISSLLFQPIDL